MLSLFGYVILLVSTVCISASPSDFVREKRSTSVTLASGGTYQTGGVSGQSLKWESSGILMQGAGPAGVNIDNCWYMKLAESGDIAPGTPVKQRIELYSYPYANSGETWKYTWKSYLVPGFTTSTHFFHLWQTFRRDGPKIGPVFTLDAIDNMIRINDARLGGSPGPSVAISQFAGANIAHSLKVTWGPKGSLSYTAVNSDSGQTLITYSASGDMGYESSIKFGTYRAQVTGMSSVTNYAGDFTSARVS